MTKTSEAVWLDITWRFNMARLAKYLGTTRQTVWAWKRAPEKHAPLIATYTGIPLADLRPDLYAIPEPAPENKDEPNG